MDTGYPGFIPEPYKHPTKTLKPYTPGKNRSISKGEPLEDQQSDDDEEHNTYRKPASRPLPKSFF